MRIGRIFYSVIFVGCIFVQTTAFAEMIQGVVKQLDVNAKLFVLEKSDQKERVQITILPNTTFEGIKGIEELRVGDEVAADIEQKKDGEIWQAKLVKIDKVKIRGGSEGQVE